MKIAVWVGVTAVAAAGLAAVVPGQSVIIPTGKAVVKVDPGCLARVVRGPYRKAVTTGTTELPTGRYRVKVRPKTCQSSRKSIRVRKGKKVALKVLNDPKMVPRALQGTIRGTQTVGGLQTASWQADVLLTLSLPASTTEAPGFTTVASYRVASLVGSYEIDTTDAGCTVKGTGTLGTADVLAGEPSPLWSNPWQANAYAMKLAMDPARPWAASKVCPEPDGTTAVTRAVPPLLFATNAWNGATPVAPIRQGQPPSGTFSDVAGETAYTYTWEFTVAADGERRVSRPA